MLTNLRSVENGSTNFAYTFKVDLLDQRHKILVGEFSLSND